MKKKIILLILTAVFAFSGLMAGCSQAEPEKPEGYAVQVIKDEKTLKWITLADFEAMEQATIEINNDTETGPLFSDVLDFADIKNYSTLTITGYSKGRIASAEITLTPSQVHDGVIMDITNSGTVKLAATDIVKNDWIRDVEQIIVE